METVNESGIPADSGEPVPRVPFTPAPDWVDLDAPESELAAGDGIPVTTLFADWQHDAASHSTFHRSVRRLETMQAVQALAQWRLQFEGRTHEVRIHWIRILRGDSTLEQGRPGKIRILQREEGLDRLVIDGWWTVLLLLEDVRPKDVLDVAYSIRTRPRLLSENASIRFHLPTSEPLGRYRVRFLHGRPESVRWITRGFPPESEKPDTTVPGIWLWQGAGTGFRPPEPLTPSWDWFHPWIQVGDIDSWQTAARSVAGAWEESLPSDEPSELEGLIPPAWTDPEVPDPTRIERILRFVQDEIRYLSVNIEMGGQIPSRPSVVLRRRFGDCKDLARLLSVLLVRIGVPARPILVSTELGRRVRDFLPSLNLFDHVVVEFELDGRRFWVDATVPKQGGGPSGRWIQPFGVGLPVDTLATGLVDAPSRPDEVDLVELHEALLLDTTGQASWLSVVETLHGGLADRLRFRLEMEGILKVSEERLQMAANRFQRAARVGSMEIQDDRDSGELKVAEVFQVSGFIGVGPGTGTCTVYLPRPNALQLLVDSAETKAERRNPVALRHPIRIRQKSDVETRGSVLMEPHRLEVATPHFRYRHRCQSERWWWSMSSEFETLEDEISTDALPKHRLECQVLFKESVPNLVFLAGHPAPPRRGDFGKLPPQTLPSRPKAPVPYPASTPAPTPPAASRPPTDREPVRLARPIPQPIRRRRSLWSKCANSVTFWIIATAVLVYIVIAVHDAV